MMGFIQSYMGKGESGPPVQKSSPFAYSKDKKDTKSMHTSLKNKKVPTKMKSSFCDFSNLSSTETKPQKERKMKRKHT